MKSVIRRLLHDKTNMQIRCANYEHAPRLYMDPELKQVIISITLKTANEAWRDTRWGVEQPRTYSVEEEWT